MFRTILGSDGGSDKVSQKHRNQQTIISDIVYINYRGHKKASSRGFLSCLF